MKQHDLIIGALYSHSALAGGLFLYEIATPDAGLSAAGLVARAQDASTAQSNPAGMTHLKGNHIMIGSQLMTTNFGFDIGPQTTTEGNNGGNPAGIWPALSAFWV